MGYVTLFEMDVVSSEDWILSNCDNSIMYTPEGQMFLEMIRMAIKDYKLYIKREGKILEAGAYHKTHDAGKYIKNVKWWLFEEVEGGEIQSPQPFAIVCEFLGFNIDVVRRSILRDVSKFSTQQSHRRTNTIKRQDVAIRARDDLISKEGGNNNACRTITGKT